MVERMAKRGGRHASGDLPSRLSDLPRSGRRLLERVVGLTPLWAVVFLLVSLASFYQHYRTSYPAYEVGQVARGNVRALVDFPVPDVAATARRQEEARRSVLPVFDYDSRSLEGFTTLLKEYFSTARQALGPRPAVEEAGRPGEAAGAGETPGRAAEAAGEGREGPLPPALQATLTRISPFPISERQLALFLRLDFELKLESALVELAAAAYAAPFLDGQGDLARQGGGVGIVVRNVFTGEERRITETSAIPDRAKVAAQLRERAAKLEGLDEEGRALAAQFLAGALHASLTYNRQETRVRQEQAAGAVPLVVYNVPKGKMIVREGDVIGAEAQEQLRWLGEARKSRWGLLNFIGVFFSLLLLLAGLLRFLEAHREELARFRQPASLVLIVLTLSLVLTELAVFIFTAVGDSLTGFPLSNSASYLYMVPFAFGGLLLNLLTTRRVALFFAVTYSLLAALLLETSYSLAAFSLAGNFLAIYGPAAYTKRTALLKTGFALGGFNAAVVATLFLLQPDARLTLQLPFEMGCAFAGGALSLLLVFITLPLFESLFHLVTDFRLLELSNLDSPLLRELTLRAPGTYHHSVIVGHLAESAAKAIGANALFVRVACYYHDVGKMSKPEYYIENIGPGENKHDRLSPRMSALILISHVKEGMEMARRHNIVPAIIDIIPQHHGTRLMTFFYNKARELAGEDQSGVQEEDYRYPGPRPRTNEAAVIMLADAVEAASRTLTDHSPARVKGLVQKIVSDIVLDGQLDECSLTFKDLEIVSNQFLRVLGGIFHQRVDYPGFDFHQLTGRAAEEARPASGQRRNGRGGGGKPKNGLLRAVDRGRG